MGDSGDDPDGTDTYTLTYEITDMDDCAHIMNALSTYALHYANLGGQGFVREVMELQFSILAANIELAEELLDHPGFTIRWTGEGQGSSEELLDLLRDADPQDLSLEDLDAAGSDYTTIDFD